MLDPESTKAASTRREVLREGETVQAARKAAVPRLSERVRAERHLWEFSIEREFG